MNPDGEFQQRLARVEGLVHTLEGLPDTAAREAARELVRCLLDLHATGLKRVLDLAGSELAGRFADDDALNSLLLLHGLHPLPVDDRVRRAIERCRARLRALGGEVDLVSATEERVRLRLRGDPDVGEAMRSALEGIVVASAPDAVIEFEEAWDRSPDGRLPLPILRGAS